MASKSKLISFSALQTVFQKPFEDEGDAVITVTAIDILASSILVITASINSPMIVEFYLLKTEALVPSQFNRYLAVYNKLNPGRGTAIGANTPFIYNSGQSNKLLVQSKKVSARSAEFYFNGSTLFPAGSTGNIDIMITYEVATGTDADLALLEYV